MIKIRDEHVGEEVVSFLIDLKKKQQEYALTEKVCYSLISLYTALKKRMFFKNLLLHPVVLKIDDFYNDKEILNEIELEKLLVSVIEFELLSTEEYLNKKERDRVIKVHKMLKIKNNGKSISVQPDI